MAVIYCSISGVPGNVTSGPFADHFKVDSFSFHTNRLVGMVTGDLANREAHNVQMGEITLTKPADNSAIELFRDSVGGNKGSQGKDVSIKFCQTGAAEEEVYIEYKLTKAIVSSYCMTAHGEGIPGETITISYGTCEIAYTDYDDANNIGSVERAGFDVGAAQVL